MQSLIRKHVTRFFLGIPLGLLVFASPSLAQTPNFASAVEYLMGGDSQQLAIGDINGDGKLDIGSTAFYGDTIHLRLGNGDGTFQASTTIVEPNAPNGLEFRDLNADLKLDLISTRVDTDRVMVRLGNGDGTFQSATPYSVGTGPFLFTIADLNNDSKLDIATANNLGDTISILLGNGNGTFGSATNFAAAAGPLGIEAVRSKNSVVLDLAVSAEDGDKFSLYPGNGSGAFATRVERTTGFNPQVLSKGDLNGDGFDDVVVPINADSSIMVFTATGDGTYNAGVEYEVGDSPSGSTIADVNVDGNRDVIVTNTNDNTVQILTGDGTGVLTPVEAIAAGSTTDGPFYVKTADLNGDALPDVLVSQQGTFQGSVNVLMNTTSVPEIDVRGNSVSIPNGSTTTSKNNNTDFGGAVPYQTPVDRTFEIVNSGAYALALGGTPKVSIDEIYEGEFSVISQPTSPVAPSGTSTFQIRFAPLGGNERIATVTIQNSDPNEASYTFTIRGMSGGEVNTYLRQKPAKEVSTGGKKKAKVEFKFRTSRPTATYRCNLNKAEFAPCTSPMKYNLKPGSYTFRVKGTASEIEDSSPAVYRFKVKK